MDLWDLAKLMGRRWYLMAPMITLTLVATSWALLTIKPDYTSTGTIILIPPADRTPLTQAELASTNSWTEVGEDIMATAVAISVSTTATRNEIENGGFSPAYEVVVADSRSSILTVTATAATAAAAQATVKRVEDQISHEVEDKQARYKPKPGRAITTQVLDGGDTIEVVSSKVKRAAVVIVAVGLLLTAAVTIVGDNILRRRARSKAELRAAAIGAGGDGEPDDDGDVIANDDRTQVMTRTSAANGKDPVTEAKAPTQNKVGGTSSGNGAPSRIRTKPATSPAGAGLTVAYRQAEVDDDRRGTGAGVEPDDATIILPLGNTPWAGREGRDKDAEARNR